MSRADYGSGSIYQRSSDGLWVGALVVGLTPEGKTRRTTVSAKTRAECKRRLAKKRAQLEAGAAPSVSARSTVAQFAEEWLRDQAVKTLRPNSYKTTRSSITKWVIPTIGHKRWADLEPRDVRAVAKKQAEAGRSTSTQLRTFSDMVVLFKAALVEGHPISPRLLALTPPKKAVNDRTDMSVEEALALLPWAGLLPHGSRFLAALLQGMRQSECLGLQWESVDFDANTITVDWQLDELPYMHGCPGGDTAPSCGKRRRASCPAAVFRIPEGYEIRPLKGRWHLVRPKTRAGFRVIPMIPVMREALLAWREHQQATIPANPHGLVWPNLDGSPTDPKVDDEEWYALQCAAGISHPRAAAHPKGPRWYTIHEARHTTATLLLEAGVDPTIIIAIMGHSDILTTRGYQHVRTERAAAALELVAERLQLG